MNISVATESNPAPAFVPAPAAPDDVPSGLASVRAQEKIQVKPTLHASPKLGAWLRVVGGSLAFTTYQSARLLMLSAGEGELAINRIIIGGLSPNGTLNLNLRNN